MIDSGENDAPPTALDLAREILGSLSHAYFAMQRDTGDDLIEALCFRIGEANALTLQLVRALTPPPTHAASDPDITGITWED